jgi:hypothetical protein
MKKRVLKSMVQKMYRETKQKGIDKRKLKKWNFRGTSKRARRNIINLLLKKAAILRRKGKIKEAEELEKKVEKMKDY